MLLYTTHISTHAIIVDCPCVPSCPLQNNQNIPYHVAIVDSTHVGSATDSFEGLGNIAHETLQQIFW